LGDWLSSLNFKATQTDIFAQQTDGTGQWFIESGEFKGWLMSAAVETLLCTGMRKTLSFTICAHSQ
jgi:hypothetical protein